MVSWGSAHVPLQKQAAILHCAAWGLPQSKIPAVIEGVKRFAVERIFSNWRRTLAAHVENNQDKITFGGVEGAPDEFEVDEAVWRKQDIGDGKVELTEFVGLKRRGDRASLYLDRRDPKHSVSSRAENGRAVPPPFSKPEWKTISDKRVFKGALAHSDGAPVYRTQPDGVLHDSISHMRRRGQKKPQFTKTTTHADASGQSFKAVAGTQSLDGWWGHGKAATKGVNARYDTSVSQRVREAQWAHWVGNRDRWVEAGRVISWIPES